MRRCVTGGAVTVLFIFGPSPLQKGAPHVEVSFALIPTRTAGTTPNSAGPPAYIEGLPEELKRTAIPLAVLAFPKVSPEGERVRETGKGEKGGSRRHIHRRGA